MAHRFCSRGKWGSTDFATVRQESSSFQVEQKGNHWGVNPYWFLQVDYLQVTVAVILQRFNFFGWFGIPPCFRKPTKILFISSLWLPQSFRTPTEILFSDSCKLEVYKDEQSIIAMRKGGSLRAEIQSHPAFKQPEKALEQLE